MHFQNFKDREVIAPKLICSDFEVFQASPDLENFCTDYVSFCTWYGVLSLLQAMFLQVLNLIFDFLFSVEREHVQKKTFTKWVNSHLCRINCKVVDLYTDLRDGKLLIKLLEILSGERLVRMKFETKIDDFQRDSIDFGILAFLSFRKNIFNLAPCTAWQEIYLVK